MKFTDKDIDERVYDAYEQARQQLIKKGFEQDKTALELLEDGWFVNQMSDLGRATDLLMDLIESSNVAWAGDTDLTEREMIQFIFNVSYSSAVGVWISDDDFWEDKAVDILESELKQMVN